MNIVIIIIRTMIIPPDPYIFKVKEILEIKSKIESKKNAINNQ